MTHIDQKNKAELVKKKVAKSLKKRHRNEWLFRNLGKLSVVISLLLVALLFINIFSKGLPAFWQSAIALDIYYDPEIITINPKPLQQQGESENDFRQRYQAWQSELSFINFNQLIINALRKELPQASNTRDLSRLVTSGERFALRDRVMANPDIIGTKEKLTFLTDANVDVWLKGNIDRNLPDNKQQLNKNVSDYSDE